MGPTTGVEHAADAFFRDLQDRICAALEGEDGAARFIEDRWERAGGGGGRSRVLRDGALFEQAGVNHSSVAGELTPEAAAGMPGDGLAFFAAGVSLVLHPLSPMVPAVHANFRCLRRGDAVWFGGGTDLTPCYPAREDVVHFHRTLRDACDRHDPDFYPRFKRWCDEYFFLPHRGETRGVGGIFFDYLTRDAERDLAFVQDVGGAFLDAYLPIVRRRRGDAYGAAERSFQLLRRGRYVEFNLLYDRGTRFGLQTGGRTESILMSLPPAVRWEYGAAFPAGSREAALQDWLRPRAWLEE
ncbi:MAG TPA: oxygen-dependent coproporphyrinogen oxidase [Polyangia bacterium]